MRALTIVGNRPQFIKAAPLSLALADAGIEEVSIHSGQHYDAAMSQVFYNELGLREPSHSLDLRTADVALLESGISGVLQLERPDWVIVFGDTNTTLAGARASVAHASTAPKQPQPRCSCGIARFTRTYLVRNSGATTSARC